MPSNSRSRIRRFVHGTFGVAVVLWFGALVLRLTVRDRFAIGAPLFYAAPWPVLMAAAMIFGLGKAWCRRRVTAACWIGVSAGCGIAWMNQSWRAHESVTATATFRMMLWNVGSSDPTSGTDWMALAATIREQDADLVALVEAPNEIGTDEARLRAEFPGCAVSSLPGGMRILTTGEVLSSRFVRLDGHSRCNVVQVRLRERSTTLVLVDIDSLPLKSRHKAFARLEDLLAKQSGADVVVLGDFNTPPDSVWFRAWRETMRNAFEASGHGFAETWPWPLPVLTLDQVWLTSALRPVACRSGWGQSDHRYVVVDVASASEQASLP